MDRGTYLFAGMGAGVVIGALVGYALNNIAICISMGIGFGAVIGAIVSTFRVNDDPEDDIK